MLSWIALHDIMPEMSHENDESNCDIDAEDFS